MLKSFPSRGRGWGHHLVTFRLTLLHEGSCDTSTGHRLTRWSWEHNLFMALISFTFLNKFSFILFSWRVNICFHFSQVPPHPTYSNDLVYDRDHGSNSTAKFHLYSWSITFALTWVKVLRGEGSPRWVCFDHHNQDNIDHNYGSVFLPFSQYQNDLILLLSTIFPSPEVFFPGHFLSSISECRKRGRCWRWIIGCSHWRCDHNCWLMAGDPIPGVPGHWVSWVE